MLPQASRVCIGSNARFEHAPRNSCHITRVTWWGLFRPGVRPKRRLRCGSMVRSFLFSGMVWLKAKPFRKKEVFFRPAGGASHPLDGRPRNSCHITAALYSTIAWAVCAPVQRRFSRRLNGLTCSHLSATIAIPSPGLYSHWIESCRTIL